MAEQHHNLPQVHGSDDLLGPRQGRPLSTWIIQPPTRRYTPPRIYNYEPHRGQETENLHINFQMDNASECLSRLKVAFSSCIMPTQAFLDPASNIIQLACTVPSWSLTQSADKTIDLYVIVASDQPHQVLDAWLVGYFTYQSKKRSSSELSMDYNTLMMKRAKPPDASSTIRVTDQGTQAQQIPPSQFILPSQHSFDYNYYGSSQQYIQPTTTATTATATTITPTNSSSTQYYHDSTSPSHIMFPLKSTTTTGSFNDTIGFSTGSMDQMTATTSGDPSHDIADPTTTTTTFDMSTSPLQHAPMSEMASPSNIPLSGTPLAPQYYQPQSSSSVSPRQGQQQHILPSPIAPTTTIPTTTDPFANLLSHADLVIEGGMDDMMRQWTDQEQQDHRRLVRLWRRQQGHEIICNFQAIPPTNRINSPQEIIVSCIYWETKNDYFITSVDIIYLLEALIGVRFTTEEKNRVRRNLEGFRPLTVSKLKPESGDFFRLIMAFHHPKPRNIEKDLKVFSWSTLPTALKKIISKYSASYSSTASVTLDAYNT